MGLELLALCLVGSQLAILGGVIGKSIRDSLHSLREEEKDLIEVYVALQGRPRSEAAKLKFNLYTHGNESEGYENFQDVLHRVVRFATRLAKSPAHRGTQVVAVSHGDVCLTARLWAEKGLTYLMNAGTSLPPEGNDKSIPYPGHVSVTTLVFQGDAPYEKPIWANRPAN